MLPCAIISPVVSSEVEAVLLDSGRLRLEFDTGERLVLKSLAGREEWLAASGEQHSLWRLAFAGPSGEARETGSADVRLARSEEGEERIEFAWEVPLGDAAAVVTMAVRCEKGRALSYWSLRAELPQGWAAARVNFPILPGIGLKDGLKLAAPAGWGLEYDMTPGTSYSGSYPSCLAAMQFVALYRSGQGLYIGAHDPAANHKVLQVSAGEADAQFTCVNWPAREPRMRLLPSALGEAYELPYEAAVGVFEGDHCDAARIYREFAFTAPWSGGGPVSGRPIPRWLKDIDLWLRIKPEMDPITDPEFYIDAARWFGVPVAVHWYKWHQIPYDTLYPEYFPANPGFTEGVRRMQEAGIRVMPYINGRLCDPNSRTWNEEGGHLSAARQENGEPYTEVYGSKVPLNVMCPQTAQWRQKIAGLVERLTGECGVDGVYIDQIGAAAAMCCFDPNHGHAPGGGSMWVEGYRRLLEGVRSRLPQGRIITTEENAECWIDQFDALLLVNTPTCEAQPIPLFPAVYSGRALAFGFQYITSEDLKRSLPWRVKMARAFVWGSQLGWVTAGLLMAPEAAREAEFLRSLAQCRRHTHGYVVCGQFLGALEVRGENPRLTGEGTGAFGGTYRIDLPAVLGSAWRAEDGRIGLLLANMSDGERRVEVTAPVDDGEAFTVDEFWPKGLVSSRRGGSRNLRVTVPARSGVLVELRAEHGERQDAGEAQC